MSQQDEASAPRVEAGRPKVIVAVCTHRRNEQLRRLLAHLVEAAAEARQLCAVGGVVVDDNVDGSARPVVAEFADRLELGVHYRLSGEQNISIARNVALEAALTNGDWIAMTDDDCVPDRRWLVELVSGQARTGADAVSGPMVRRAPASSPRWLVDQPFLEQGVPRWERDTELWFASTHNSMLSATWVRRHPDHRFDPQLGRLGGEDMLFFKTAHRRGLRITYSPDAIVFEDQPVERLSYGFFLKQALWLGNSSLVTSVQGGETSRTRMVAHGLARLGRAVVHPLQRLARRRTPQFRYSVALAAGGVGVLLGTLGVRIRHH
jgi:succinoglycan biosynthesis protein ExoM